jgi:hypothetical protein
MGWVVNGLHQMRAEVSSINIAAVAETGGVVTDAARNDHLWMTCQGDGGANSEPVLDNDIKVGGFGCSDGGRARLCVLAGAYLPHVTFA